MGTKLYVGNLNYNTGEQALRELFSANGREVASVAVIMDRETGRSRGFAFVEMATAEGAQAALRELDGHDLEGRQLRINEARERESRGPGGPPRPSGSYGPPRTGGFAGGGAAGGGGGYAGGGTGGPSGGGYGGGGGTGGPSGGGYGGGGADRPASAPSDRARTFGPAAPPAGTRRPAGRKDKDKDGGRPTKDAPGAKRGGAKRRTGDDGDY